MAYGQRWSHTDAPQALGVYCAYILLLAVNGILEAFVHATARSRQAVCNLGVTFFCDTTQLMSKVARLSLDKGLVSAGISLCQTCGWWCARGST